MLFSVLIEGAWFLGWSTLKAADVSKATRVSRLVGVRGDRYPNVGEGQAATMMCIKRSYVRIQTQQRKQ